MITTTEKSKYVLPEEGLLLSEDEAFAKMNPLSNLFQLELVTRKAE